MILTQEFRGIILNTTNKMQRYTVLFIIVNVVHVSGGFSAHHQELKIYTHSIWYRGPDKSLAQAGSKRATATEGFEFHISYL